MRGLYLLLAAVGLVVPYYFLIGFLLDHGLNVRLAVEQLFATPISSFFAADVLVSAVVLWVYIIVTARKERIRWAWVCLLGTLTVGVSFALPLFLFLREQNRKALPAVEPNRPVRP